VRLFAAIVSEETRTPSGYLKGWGKALSDLDALKKSVAEAWSRITEMRQGHPVPDWQAVFLAPEYFFSNRRDAQDRFFAHETKRIILKGLASMAKNYPQLLIVPGTVLWTKELYDKTPTGPQQNAARLNKARARNQYARATFGTSSGQDWSFTGDMTATNVKIAQNVAYVCLGDQIVKYHKVGNYKEVEGEKGNIYFASGSIVGRFSVGGVKYGLEVCMDHALGALDTTIAAQGQVHIHLIISSYVKFSQRSTAPVTLHSSTEGADILLGTDKGEFGRPGEVSGNVTQFHDPGTRQVRFVSGGGARLAAGFKSNPLKLGPLTIWVIDLDNTKLGINNVTNYEIRDTALQSIKADYLV